MFCVNFKLVIELPTRQYAIPAFINGEFPELTLSVISGGGMQVWDNPDWMAFLGEWRRRTIDDCRFKEVAWANFWDRSLWIRLPREVWASPRPETGIVVAEEVVAWLSSLTPRPIGIQPGSVEVIHRISWEELRLKLGNHHRAILNKEWWRAEFDES